MQTNLEINSTEQDRKESRTHPRLDVDLGTLIQLSLHNDHFQPSYNALILDGSLGGCGIITVNKDNKLFQTDYTCYLKAPEASHTVIKARIVWVKERENKVFRLGLEYID